MLRLVLKKRGHMKIKLSQKGNSIQLDYDESSLNFDSILLKTDENVIYQGKLKKLISLKDKVKSSQFIYLYLVEDDLSLFYSRFYFRTGDDSYLKLLKEQREYFYVKLKNKKNRLFINEFAKEIKGVINNVIK